MRADDVDVKSTRGTWRRLAALCLFLGALAVLAGCGGGGGSSTAAESQLRAAKKAGEEAAHEKDRVSSLQKQVNKLRHQVHHQPQAESSTPATSNTSSTDGSGSAGEVLRSFHVASGNVSCEIRADGATCTVEPIAQTFAFSGGEPAYSESGTALPEDLGEVAPYGSTVSAGSVSCEIPPTSVPRGIVCSDSASGHGFEASRVPERQSVY